MTHKKYNLIIFAIALLWAPAVWAAPDDLEVEFQATPLFNEANFLPGSEVSRWTKVKNNTPVSKPIIVETINESDPEELADVFEIGIYESGIQRYATTTLADFFDAGEVSLSDLAGEGVQTQYDFLVRFVPGANDSYQEKSLGFDILIGFKGQDEGGDDGTFETNLPNGGGGGGGGSGGGGGEGGGILSGMVIQNEAAVIVTDTTATIQWNTSFSATSRVVYGTIPGVFNFGLPPNYGYDFSTDEFNTPANPNGVTFHTVIVTGLAPSTTYYFRTISHASPDTISKEVSFTTRGNHSNGVSSLSPFPLGPNVSPYSENAPSSQMLASGNETGQTQNEILSPILENTPGANNAQEQEQEPIFEETTQDIGNDNASLLVAALFGLGNIDIWWLFLAPLLLLIAYLIYRSRKKLQR